MLIIFELLIASIHSQIFVEKVFNEELDSGEGSNTGYQEKNGEHNVTLVKKLADRWGKSFKNFF